MPATSWHNALVCALDATPEHDVGDRPPVVNALDFGWVPGRCHWHGHGLGLHVDGELGNGANTTSNVPVAVTAVSPRCSILDSDTDPAEARWR